jgi:hypothetical protein
MASVLLEPGRPLFRAVVDPLSSIPYLASSATAGQFATYFKRVCVGPENAAFEPVHTLSQLGNREH